MTFDKESKGFTLIELLVVISIIGFLVSATVYAVNVARKKSRDARRLEDLAQMQKALELYYHDNNRYPPINSAWTYTSFCGNNWCYLENALAPYIKPLPRDPAGPQGTYKYHYDADSGDSYQSYGLMIMFEYKENYYLSQNDGGYYSTGSGIGKYEIGSQPKYCMSKYSGTGRQWFGGTNNVCEGGN
ncbi:MAG: type II secretion system protein [Patescibacteria group bacterium]|nr:type II secretion system protein [Patescibacteria group bacterium]